MFSSSLSFFVVGAWFDRVTRALDILRIEEINVYRFCIELRSSANIAERKICFFFFLLLLRSSPRVGILIYKNRSTKLRRCPRPLAHCSHTICSSYLSVRGLANTQRLFFFFSFLQATVDDKHIVYRFFFFFFGQINERQR